MNELIMRALSYVDDRWITEAMSDYETVKMKHFFQKERRKKYLCTAVCIAAAAFIMSISLIWSILHKNMNNHLDNHPLLPTLVETQSESESLLETKSAVCFVICSFCTVFVCLCSHITAYFP